MEIGTKVVCITDFFQKTGNPYTNEEGQTFIRTGIPLKNTVYVISKVIQNSTCIGLAFVGNITSFNITPTPKEVGFIKNNFRKLEEIQEENKNKQKDFLVSSQKPGVGMCETH